MGKSAGKKAQQIQTNVADKGFGISDQATSQLMPYLKQSGDYYSTLAKGDPVALSRTLGPQLELSRTAFDNTTKQIERTMPSGGLRTQALAELDTQRAGDISKIMNGGVADAIQHLEGLGQTGAQIGLQGLGVSGNAGDSLARLSAAKAQSVGQGIAGLAGGVGSIVGAKSAKPAAPSQSTAGSAFPSVGSALDSGIVRDSPFTRMSAPTFNVPTSLPTIYPRLGGN